jgi:transposase
MYFRTKFIKSTALVQLVESYRNTEGLPRQRIVVSLGDAAIPDVDKTRIARAVEAHMAGSVGLFAEDLSQEAASWVTRIISLLGRSKSAKPVASETVDGVILDQIQTGNLAQLGPELVAMEAWKDLGLSAVIAGLGFNASQIATAQLMIANRLIEPLSEWALIAWAQRTALPELLDVRLSKSTKDRLYLTSDALLAGKKSIETHLRQSEADLFSLNRSIVLYDVTNTHFEGLCSNNPKAHHGKNKQKRNDCPQVAVGIAFDEKGLPLAHEVFEGHIADAKTLETLLARLEIPEGGLKPVVILDAGFASKETLAAIKSRGYSYLVNITRGSRAKYAKEFKKDGFEQLPGRKTDQKVEVRKIADPDDAGSQLVLCRSAQRCLKEEAMISKAEARFLADAKSLSDRIEKGLLKKSDLIERKIGELQKKHARVRRFYTLKHSGGQLEVVRDEEKMTQALDLCGDYVLKTDQTLGAPQLWSLYMTLLKAEDGFALLKGTLGLRPNYHQLEDRVDGHIFISVLAFHLLSWVRQKFEAAGDMREWKTIRRLLSTHSLVSTWLPLSDGRTVHIRKASVPDPEQVQVYKILDVDWKKAFPTVKSVFNPYPIL